MFRSRLIREGSVGLFILLGLAVFGGAVFFLKKSQLSEQNYRINLLFQDAGGIREGARVFFRGVAVGRVVSIQPTSNGVAVITEIDNRLPIPRDVTVSTTRSGLLGEVSVNIIPQGMLSEGAKQINPLSQDCQEKQLILCSKDEIQAQASPDLIASLSRLADSFDDQQFFDNLNNAVENITIASENFSTLTKKVTVVAEKIDGEMANISRSLENFNNTASTINDTANSISDTANSVTRTSDVASAQLQRLGDEYTNTAQQLTLLATNLNQVITENQSTFQEAIVNLSATAKTVGEVAQTTNEIVSRINGEDVETISQNLVVSSENLVKLSEDLSAIAEQLNSPTNLVTLQQTLDSARVTFANTAKITSDIEEFTGDPEFRQNLRRLINGLSSLVSYGELLEKQVQLAIILEEATLSQGKSKFTVAK